MIRSRLSVLAALATVASSAAAQSGISSQCPAGTTRNVQTQDACQKAVDIFAFMAPQLGTALTGGNPTMGKGAAYGTFGKFSAEVRVTAVQGAFVNPSNINPSTTGAQSDELLAEDSWIPAPVVDGAVGLFPGIKVGNQKVLAIDGLVNIAYIPASQINKATEDFVFETPDGALKLGYGGRIGLLADKGWLPGVSVSYLSRPLPTLNIAGQTGSNDTLRLNNASVKTTSTRIVAGKRLLKLFTIAAGVGQDTYKTGADMYVSVHEGTVNENRTVSFSQDLTRTNMFADFQVNLFLIKAIAEVGKVSGGSVSTYNTFSNNRKADDGYNYIAAGVRLGF